MYRNVKKELKRQAAEKTPAPSGALASFLREETQAPKCRYRTRPNLQKRTVAAVLAVFAAVLAGLGVFRISGNLPEAPSSETQQYNHAPIGLIVVSAAGTQAEEAVSIPTHPDFTMELPVKGLLAVERLADASEESKLAAEHSINGKMREYLRYTDADCLTYRVKTKSMTNVTVGYGTVNTFILCGLDTEALETIRISLEGFGAMEVEPAGGEPLNASNYLYDRELVITKSQFERWYRDPARLQGTALFTYWDVSGQMLVMLNAEPELPLSFFHADVTFTVSYTDGESQSFHVKITFNDRGEMCAVYKK